MKARSIIMVTTCLLLAFLISFGLMFLKTDQKTFHNCDDTTVPEPCTVVYYGWPFKVAKPNPFFGPQQPISQETRALVDNFIFWFLILYTIFRLVDFYKKIRNAN